jgi:4-hydroxy-3-methylbut-2-enyl diphosphate reductase IspH
MRGAPSWRRCITAAELEPTWRTGAQRNGVTAGASTPDEEIEATVAALHALSGD